MSAPKLTPELEALFQAERVSEPLPDGFGERLRSRIDRSIGPVGGPGGDGGPSDGGPSDGGSSGGPGGDLGASAAGTAAAGFGVVQAGALLGVFGLGLVAGAFGHASLTDEPAEPAPQIEPSEHVEVEPVVIPEPVEDVLPEPIEVEAIVVPVREVPVVTEATPMARVDGRALLDQAQNALARGLAREALQALDEHRRSHRRGPLREERQALQVQALGADGQSLRAQQEAAIFLARYPNSLFRDMVERAARPER